MTHTPEAILQKLADPGLSREATVLLIIRLIELRFPDWKIEMTGPEEVRISKGDGDSHTMYFQNMLAECRQGQDERADIVDRYIRLIVPHTPDKKTITLENLVTLVRDDNYMSVVDGSVRIAASHFVADLWLVLARNDDESVTSLNRDEALALGSDMKALVNRGIENVNLLLEGLSAERREHCYVLNSENLFFVSTSMALDFVWDQLEELVQGDIVLGVPATDTVMFCGIEENEAIRQLREEVSYVIRNGHHLVTDHLFCRSNGHWRVFS